MIQKRDWSKIEMIELELERQPASYAHNRLVFDGLYKQARRFGHFSDQNSLAGVDVHTKVAVVFNAIRRTSQADRHTS